AVFDGPESGHGELLVTHLTGSVPSVVGRGDDQLRAHLDGVAHDVVVGDLVADDRADRGAPDVEQGRLVPPPHVPGVVDERREPPRDVPHRHVLGEGYEFPFDVVVGDAGGTVAGLPDEGGVLGELAAGWLVQRPDEGGNAEVVDERVELRVVAARVGGGFGPHDEIGWGEFAGADAFEQFGAFGEVVGSDGVASADEFDAHVGGVALDDGDGAGTVL